MARVMADAAEVNARILYWGIEGAGKRTSLTKASEKLRPDHRGELTETPTPFDPSAGYTVLPIELGDIAGLRTRIELVAVPGGADHTATRKQLLDQVDGVVLLIDAQQDLIEENVAIVEELRKSLADYARRLEDLPHVVQYNKRDLSDAYAIDELHRRLGLGSATVFETVATEATGVLQALSTISKKVIRTLRGENIGTHRAAPEPPPAATPEPLVAQAAPEPSPRQATADPLEESVGLEASLDPLEESVGLEASLDPLEQSVGLAELVDPLEPEPSASATLERAILAEGAEAEAQPGTGAADSLFEQPWHHEADALEPPLGARISQELSIVSVGQATRADDRSVRVPLVLGDGEGETSTVVLTLRLDPLIDETGS